MDLVDYFKRKAISQQSILTDVKSRLAAGMEALTRNAQLEQKNLELKVENQELRSKLGHQTERVPASYYHASDGVEGLKRRRDSNGNGSPS